jgi:hypothetical protein
MDKQVVKEEVVEVRVVEVKKREYRSTLKT